MINLGCSRTRKGGATNQKEGKEMTDADVTQAPITAETPLALPRYRSHKTVEALKIEQIIYGDHGGGAPLHPADTRDPPFKMTAEYVAKDRPRAGGDLGRYGIHSGIVRPPQGF